MDVGGGLVDLATVWPTYRDWKSQFAYLRATCQRIKVTLWGNYVLATLCRKRRVIQRKKTVSRGL